MSQRFSGKVVLVTGAASGIGRACAKLFAADGAKVAVVDVDAAGGTETVRLVRESGGEAEFFAADVAAEAQVEAMVAGVVARFGQLDCAVNNAGIAGVNGGVADHTEADWDRILGVNLKGVWLCLKHELPHLRARGGGAIVNVASVAGLIGSAGSAAYTASKHGVVGLTKAVALECAPQGIRVNAVCPGIVRTPMLEGLLDTVPDLEAQLAAIEPVGRLATADEAAQAVVWLCSDAASFMTGASMPVDGGLSAR